MKNDPVLKNFEIFPANLPLNYPFVTALGRKNITRNVFVRLTFSDNISGVGEASGSLAIPSATQEVLIKELISFKQQMEGMKLSQALAFAAQGVPEQVHPTSFSAMEMALFDANARFQKIPLYRLFGNKPALLTTSFTISAWPANDAARIAGKEWTKGYRKFKIKVGTSWDQDLKRILAVREAVPKAEILLDGNQGFTAPGAIELVDELHRRHIPIVLMEQPLPKDSSWDEWIWIKEKIGTPLALDESISSFKEAKEHIYRRTVDVINIKLAKSGLGESLRIIKLARQSGIQLMIGCMAESGVGLSASVHLAAGLGCFDFIDLDSAALLKPDKKIKAGFVSKGPELKIPGKHPGSGADFKLKPAATKQKRKTAAV